MDSKNNKYLDRILNKNEINTNIFLSILSVLMSTIFIIYMHLFNLELEPNHRIVTILLLVIQLVLYIGPIVCLIKKGRLVWLKYLLLFSFVISSCCAVYMFEAGVFILIVLIPVVSSCLYYSPKLTVFVSLLSIICLFISILFSIFVIGSLYPDMNCVVLQDGVSVNVSGYLYYDLIDSPIDKVEYFKQLVNSLLFPIFVIYIVICNICYLITKRAKDFANDQANSIKEKISIESELNLAASIQKNMLPNNNINTNKFEINYYLSPAKQVGGDFYDYFMIDNSKLAIVIGDVSDKGVPASLFMARCKTLISSLLLAGNGLKEAINKVNKELCTNNTSGMFVTAFIGVVDINTGEMEYINAGHCCPIIMNSNNEYRFIDVYIDLFLGGMDDIDYMANKIHIDENEKIILYTDGIIEASNKNDELYGSNRLLSILNCEKDCDNNHIIKTLINDINNYIDGNEQNDDITLLIYTRKGM